MIAQRFEFTRHFPKAWNTSVYFQLRKMSCGFKDQARFCPSGEKCGLVGRHDERWGKPLLIVASFVFYGFWIPAYLVLLIVSILFNHAIARAVLAGPEQRLRRALTALGILLNLALIAFYKYAAFLVESLNWTFQTGFDIPDIVLPIGISFFTFQQISLLLWARQLGQPRSRLDPD